MLEGGATDQEEEDVGQEVMGGGLEGTGERVAGIDSGGKSKEHFEHA